MALPTTAQQNHIHADIHSFIHQSVEYKHHARLLFGITFPSLWTPSSSIYVCAIQLNNKNENRTPAFPPNPHPMYVCLAHYRRRRHQHHHLPSFATITITPPTELISDSTYRETHKRERERERVLQYNIAPLSSYLYEVQFYAISQPQSKLCTYAHHTRIQRLMHIDIWTLKHSLWYHLMITWIIFLPLNRIFHLCCVGASEWVSVRMCEYVRFIDVTTRLFVRLFVFFFSLDCGLCYYYFIGICVIFLLVSFELSYGLILITNEWI